MDGGSVVSWARLPSESLACETSGSAIRALAAREGWWFSGQSAGSSREGQWFSGQSAGSSREGQWFNGQSTGSSREGQWFSGQSAGSLNQPGFDSLTFTSDAEFLLTL